MWRVGGEVCVGGSGWAWCLLPQAFVLTAVLAVILALVLGVLWWDARRTPLPSEAAARANRHATLTSAVGVVALVVALAWLVAATEIGIVYVRDGRVLATLPAVAGACLLAAQALGNVTWPRPTGTHREAALASRTVADVVPASQRRRVWGWAATALGLLVVFGMVADGPRSLTSSPGASPGYPGWYYGVPMAVAVIALVAGTEAVLRLITNRPAVVGVSTAWDLHLRRRSATSVTRGIQLVLAITVAGTLVAASWGHRALVDPQVPRPQDYLAPALLVAALGVLVAGIAFAVLPQRGARREPGTLREAGTTEAVTT